MQNDEQSIRELVAEWQKAAGAGDLLKLLSLMAEDVVFYVVGQSPMRGREAFAEAFRAVVQQVHIESTAKIEEVEVTGNFAHLASHLTVTMKPLQGGAIMRRSGLHAHDHAQGTRWALGSLSRCQHARA
jgi:uncharacterized protein (TIGR02246 family)